MGEGWKPVLVVLAGLAFQLTMAGLVLLRPPRRQSSSLAWILIILVVPVLGAASFLLFGDVRTGSRMRRRHRDITTRLRAAMAGSWQRLRPAELPDVYRPIANLGYQVGETAPRAGNRIDLIADTDELVAALVRDIDAAQDHCHLLYYIYLADASGRRIAEALRRAADRGVACRLLVDAVGSSRFLESSLRRELRAGGVRVVAALPTRLRLSRGRIDLRNHRKIAVVDGRVAYSGSHNVAEAAFAPKPRFAPWVDATLRVQGPAVLDLQELFLEDWFLDTGESLEELLSIVPEEEPEGIAVQVLGTGPNTRIDALVQLIQAALHHANEELILTTPYFVPDEGTLDAIATAALRGVDTVLVLPARNDSLLVGAASRSLYEPLLEAGVRIFEFTEGLLHAKTITIDRHLAFVSTANLDRRSFELNFEVSLMIYDSDCASRIRFLQRDYMERSRVIDPRRWAARSRLRKIAHNAAGILAPIL